MVFLVSASRPARFTVNALIALTVSGVLAAATGEVDHAIRLLPPLRGIAYGALPCREQGCGSLGGPSEDMLQLGYKPQWGATGRDDLGVMARLGANAVRLYHSLGLPIDVDHGAFLDHAESLHLQVMPGFDTYRAGDCVDFDCFEVWKTATLMGFKHGFKKEGGWHPAVSTLILLNEPDFFDSWPQCRGRGAWCYVRASLSAMDGVLAAERELGIAKAERVKLTVAWSFAMRTSIDGKVSGPGIFGFQDMAASVQNPQLAGYQPRSSLAEMQEAYRTRWVHCLNTQAPWGFVRDVIGGNMKQFEPTPWFIGEYGANGQPEEVIRSDLESMQKEAESGSLFWGAAMFQFQTAYAKGGSELNFGLFGLETKQVAQTEFCKETDPDCKNWPVYCLTPELDFLSGSLAHRAAAVAAAWNGVVDTSSPLCAGGHRRRLDEVDLVTDFTFQV